MLCKHSLDTLEEIRGGLCDKEISLSVLGTQNFVSQFLILSSVKRLQTYVDMAQTTSLLS